MVLLVAESSRLLVPIKRTTEKTAEEVKADTVKPEKKGTAEVTFKRTDCHQNEWLEFLVVFSKKIVLYRQSFGEGIEEATKIFRFNYSYTANRPGNEIVSIEIDKKMRSTIYREYENVVFFSDYRIAETFAMGLFIRYGHKTWIRNQSIAKLQLVSNSRAFASLEIDDASYIFFTSLYMYYEMHSKSNNTCGEFKDFVYETILNNFNLELGIKSKVFDIEERKNFFFGEDSCQKQYFLIYFSLCLSKLIIQCDADIYDSEIKGKEKRKRKEERVAIAEKCKIRQYIKHVFDYIEDNHNTKICYDRCVNAMELKDFSD